MDTGTGYEKQQGKSPLVQPPDHAGQGGRLILVFYFPGKYREWQGCMEHDQEQESQYTDPVDMIKPLRCVHVSQVPCSTEQTAIGYSVA